MNSSNRVAALRYAVKCATETDSTMALVPVSMARAAADDIERMQGIDRGTTHADGCWGWGPKHYDCAAAEIERLQLELRLAVAARDYANDLLDRERQRAAHELPVARKSDKFDLAFEIMRQLEAEDIETMQSCQFGYVMRITREGASTPIDPPRLTDHQCDEIIAELETYEWTGFSRDDVRLIARTIHDHRELFEKIEQFNTSAAGPGCDPDVTS